MHATLILAGGRGMRLGGADKAFLQLGGVLLLDRLVARLAPQTGSLAISANGDLARFSAYNLPVLPDEDQFAGKGPLAGVAAGLAWAAGMGAASLLTVPVDTPFVPDDLAARLSSPPAVAVWQARQHHLVAHWPVSFLPMLKIFLTKPGAYKVRDALKRAGARPVNFEAASDPFHNINTPADFAAAAASLNKNLA